MQDIKCVKGKSCLHCNTNYCQFVEEVNNLKAENEELKEEYDKTLTLLGTINNDRERRILQSQQDKNITDRYKQALEDVKKNAKNICEYCGNRDTKWCNNDCDVFNELTIINEVLKDE